MKLKKTVGILLSLCLVAFVAADWAQAASGSIKDLPKMTITYAHANNGTIENADHVAAVVFKEHVEKYSQGRITVEISPGGALGNTAELMNLAMMGEVEVVGSNTEGTIAAVYPDIQVIAIPYLFDTVDQAKAVFDGEFGHAMFEDMRQKTGLRVIGWWDNGGFRCFTNSKREIKSPADMKGLKIRTMSIPAHMEIVKRLGANATPISWGELYTALETGVADGQENSIPTIIEGSVHEVQKHIILDNHVYSQMHNMVNDEWFNSLPDAYKIIVQTAGEKSAYAAARKYRAKRIYGLNLIKKHMKVYAPSMAEVAEFRKLTQKPVLSFIKAKLKNPAWSDRILKAAKDANKRLGYE